MIDPQLSLSTFRHVPKTKFSADDLERLVRLTAEELPWTKPRGQVTRAWENVLQQLQLEGRFETSSVTTLQNKINVLVAWQEVFPLFSGIFLPTDMSLGP